VDLSASRRIAATIKGVTSDKRQGFRGPLLNLKEGLGRLKKGQTFIEGEARREVIAALVTSVRRSRQDPRRRSRGCPAEQAALGDKPTPSTRVKPSHTLRPVLSAASAVVAGHGQRHLALEQDPSSGRLISTDRTAAYVVAMIGDMTSKERFNRPPGLPSRVGVQSPSSRAAIEQRGSKPLHHPARRAHRRR